jgi:hypothetical protein
MYKNSALFMLFMVAATLFQARQHLDGLMGGLIEIDFSLVETDDLRSSQQEVLPFCLKETAIYPKYNYTKDSDRLLMVHQAEEVLAYIVTKLNEIGAPATPVYGNLLKEYRNGTGPCLHAQPDDKDFDLGVLSHHFDLVVNMTDEIQDIFGWTAMLNPGMLGRKFFTMYPPKRHAKFQIDIYGFQCDTSTGLVYQPWDKRVVELGAFLPLRPYKPVLQTTSSNKTTSTSNDLRNKPPAFYHMPYNIPCLLENMYGADFMTPKGIVGKKNQAIGRPYGHPYCNTTTLTVEEQIELERQLAYCQ